MSSGRYYKPLVGLQLARPRGTFLFVGLWVVVVYLLLVPGQERRTLTAEGARDGLALSVFHRESALMWLVGSAKGAASTHCRRAGVCVTYCIRT